jgi:O-antigen/teichoic acid export membrane protein
VTVVLDVLLIPSHHAIGAAIASAAAYLTVTACLLTAFHLTQQASKGIRIRRPQASPAKI